MSKRDDFNQPTVPHYAHPDTPRLPQGSHQVCDHLTPEMEQAGADRMGAFRHMRAQIRANWARGDRFRIKPYHDPTEFKDDPRHPRITFFDGCTGTFLELKYSGRTDIVSVEWDQPEAWKKRRAIGVSLFYKQAEKIP